MSKAHRGKGLHETYNRGRGICPMCNKTGVKVIYEQEISGEKKTVCKICKATLENKKKLAEAAAPKPAENTETSEASAE